MLTINTTFHVEDMVNLDFINYMKNNYIKEAQSDKQLMKARMCKVHSQELPEGHSYSIQFSFENLENLENWDKTMGKELNKKLLEKFEDKVTGFSTLLEEIEL